MERKKLEMNVEKTKVIRFKRGRGRRDKRVWRWRGKVIEEVKEFRHLGYIMQKNGGQEAHVRERRKKAAALLGRVWGIGKRRFGGDLGRRKSSCLIDWFGR